MNKKMKHLWQLRTKIDIRPKSLIYGGYIRSCQKLLPDNKHNPYYIIMLIIHWMIKLRHRHLQFYLLFME